MSNSKPVNREDLGGRTTTKEIGIIVAHGLVGWGICGAIMAIGTQFMSLETTLIVHAIGAPIVFAAVSWIYFTRFNYTTPLQTAIAFVSVVILMDIFVVSLLINGNFDMFASFLGTWLVFALIFLSTYLTGLTVENRGSGAYH
jgi:hypothetical protein